MNLILPEQMDDRIDAIFGPGFSAALQKAAQAIDRNRLREISPVSWITCPVQREEIKRERA